MAAPHKIGFYYAFCLYRFNKICLWFKSAINIWSTGRGGGQVVSMLAFYSDDPSSNPADAYSFSVQIVFEKNENV